MITTCNYTNDIVYTWNLKYESLPDEKTELQNAMQYSRKPTFLQKEFDSLVAVDKTGIMQRCKPTKIGMFVQSMGKFVFTDHHYWRKISSIERDFWRNFFNF